MGANELSHRQHKLMIFALKIIPAFMAVSYLMNTLCAFLGVGFQIVTHYLGLFLAPMMFMYIASYVFKFCWYHRIFIHYMVIIEMLNITDWYFKIPISNDAICYLHFGITAAFILGVAIYYLIKWIKKRC